MTLTRIKIAGPPLGVADRLPRVTRTRAEAAREAERLNAAARRQRAEQDAANAARLRATQGPTGRPPARGVRGELTADERTKLEAARRHLDDVLGDRSAEEPAEPGQESAQQAQAAPAARPTCAYRLADAVNAQSVYAARREATEGGRPR